jgi:bifunctional DNA-binding transcriptional regulator/antitoxin component of YhaV-PrlF toxin-antitoxin module
MAFDGTKTRFRANECPINGQKCRIAEFLVFCYVETMKTILTVSSRGVISLPAKLRRVAGIHPEQTLIAESTSEGILLRPAITLPLEIYTEQRVAEFDAGEAELEKILTRGSKA